MMCTCGPRKYMPPAVALTALARMKGEIRADIEDGVVPPTVATFAELHDYVDANTYGGLCDPQCPPHVWGAADWVQEQVDQWLQAGRP